MLYLLSILSLFLIQFVDVCWCENVSSITPVKSEHDSRDYRVIKLKNKLQVLLISDPETDTSAASMDVYAGSFDNPKSVLGLAHFLEHMLFLGTKKYPNINEFSGFLAQHYGSDNAYTAALHTNYMFDVGPNDLQHALDIWAQFFIEPLFAQNATSKELNAVNAEHSKNLRNDGWRQYALMKHTADENSVFHLFSTGNKDTLETVPAAAGVNVREELLKFHAKHYIPENMKLCVLGRESLDELQHMIEPVSLSSNQHTRFLNQQSQLFAALSGAPSSARAPFSLPYTRNDNNNNRASLLGRRVLYEPVKDQRLVTLLFQVDPWHVARRVQPLRFAAHLIGYEGPGSLLSVLRDSGLALGVNCYSQEATPNWNLFAVDIELTANGLAEVDTVVGLFFEYMAILRNNGDWLETWREWRDLASIKFRFKDKEDPYSYVSDLANRMHDYNAEDVLQSPAVPLAYDDMATNQLLHVAIAALNASAFNMYVAHPDAFASGSSLSPNAHEPWYDIDYRNAPIPTTLLATWLWTNSVPPPRVPPLHVPPKNRYIPKNVEVNAPDDTARLPAPIVDADDAHGRGQAWYSQETDIALPKTSVTVRLAETQRSSTLVSDVATQLYVALVLDSLQEQLYPARLAGISYSAAQTSEGVVMGVAGYTDKLPLVLSALVERIAAPPEFGKRFDIVRNAMLRDLANSQQEWPVRVLHQSITRLLAIDRRRWSPAERSLVLDTIVVDEASMYTHARLHAAHIQMLAHGNLQLQDAFKLFNDTMNLVSPHVTLQPLGRSSVARRVLRVNDGEHWLWRERTEPGESNGAAIVYLQCGQLPLRQRLLLSVLGPVIGDQAFTELRTKQQLGYIVWGFVRHSANVGGVYIEVQSSVVSPAAAVHKIDLFLDTVLRPFIHSASAAQWQAWRDAAIASRQEKPKSIDERATAYWHEVAIQRWDFDGVDRDVAILKTLTHDEAKSFVDLHFFSNSTQRRRITAERWQQLDNSPTTPFPPPPQGVKVLTDAALFRATHDAFGVESPIDNPTQPNTPTNAPNVAPGCPTTPQCSRLSPSTNDTAPAADNSAVVVLSIFLAIAILSVVGMCVYVRNLRNQVAGRSYTALSEQ